jgi:phosphoglycolate phosphatase
MWHDAVACDFLMRPCGKYALRLRPAGAAYCVSHARSFALYGLKESCIIASMTDAICKKLPLEFDRATQFKSKLPLTNDANQRLIIFDFDGTLADTFSWCISIFDEIADKFRFKRLDRNKLDALRNLEAHQLMAQHQIALWKLPFIVRSMRARMQRDIANIALFPGIEQTLRALSDKGMVLAIVSSNSHANVLRILGPENAERFTYFECGVSLFGKRSRLRRLLTVSKTSASATILIGDEIRDAQAAKKAGIPFGAVAWGYNHIDALRSHGAQHVFDDVGDMQKMLIQ